MMQVSLESKTGPEPVLIFLRCESLEKPLSHSPRRREYPMRERRKSGIGTEDRTRDGPTSHLRSDDPTTHPITGKVKPFLE
jgi:hypothetical protein